MKLPKELTTVTPFSKYLAMTLFIFFPFVGFYLGMHYQSKLDAAALTKETIIVQHIPASSPVVNPTIVQTNWKLFTQSVPADKTPEYTDPVFSISMHYPPAWTVKEFHTHSNRVVDNPAEINTAVFAGKEGQITMEWGPMGFGGGGCPLTPFHIENMSVNVCDSIQKDGSEQWYFLNPATNQPAKVTATAHAPYGNTALVVKTILATITFK